MAESPDHTLIERAQDGDEDAVAGLYRRYVRAITRYVAYRVSEPGAVEDLTAEVFLRMVEGLPRYRVTGAPFEAWLYRIAAARIADYYRRRQHYQEEALTEALRDGHGALDLTLLQHEELEELRTALGKLSEEQRTILILRFVERKSHQDVAEVLSKSVHAIATAQHRALKKLAELLGTDKSGHHYFRGESS